MTATTVRPAAPPKGFEDTMLDIQDLWVATLAWLQTNWLQIIVAGALAVGIIALLFALRRFGAKWCDSEQRRGQWLSVIGRTISKTTSYFILMVAIRLVDGYAQTPQALDRVIVFLFTIAAVLQGAIWARELILGAIEHKTMSEHYRGETIINAMGLIRLLVSVVVFAIATVVLLDNLGVNVTGLVAGLGVGGIAIGLAAQGIFSDLFASLSIIFDRPFRVGETIKYDTSTATVERIGLKSTRLRSVNGELLVISNTNLLAKEITNFAHLHRRRVTFTIGVIYQTTPAMLRDLPALLKEQVKAAGHEFIRSSFLTFGPSSLDFELLFDVFTDDFEAVVAARTDVAIRLFEAMTAAGYHFAYPTQTTFTAAPDGTMILPYAESVTMKTPKPTQS